MFRYSIRLSRPGYYLRLTSPGRPSSVGHSFDVSIRLKTDLIRGVTFSPMSIPIRVLHFMEGPLFPTQQAARSTGREVCTGHAGRQGSFNYPNRNSPFVKTTVVLPRSQGVFDTMTFLSLPLSLCFSISGLCTLLKEIRTTVEGLTVR